MLVVVHEFGHYIMARRSGVEVEEFGLGFPPKVWGKKLKNGTLFSVNLLPLGGFVKLKGEHDADTEKGSYGAASLANKTKIIVAGVVMNIVVAVLIFTGLALVGMPRLVDDQFTVASDTKTVRNDVIIGAVEKDSPAEKAGLQPRDRLIAVSDERSSIETVTSQASLPQITERFAGEEVAITVVRNNEELTVNATLRSAEEIQQAIENGEQKGYMGVTPIEYTLRRSTWSAPIVGLGVTKQFAQLTYGGIGSALKNLFTGNAGKAGEQVAGPLGIFVIIREGSRLGFEFILMIVAVISLTLALINVLPIPALDGGRLFVTYLYRLLKKPLSPKAEELIHGTGMAVLLLLFVIITVVDVRRFF
jgi:regulator of sigma E protease